MTPSPDDRQATRSGRAARPRPGGIGPGPARPAQGLPRRLARRGEDLHDARGRPRQARGRPRRRGRGGRDPRPGRDGPAARGLEVLPRQPLEYRGTVLEEFDLDARPRPPSRAAAGRRAGPHQRARLPPRQALAGRRGAARRRHQRLHHAQHPAPREPERRRRADHRASRCARRCPTPCSSGPTRSSWWTSRPTSCSSGSARARSTSPSRRAARSSASSGRAT